MLAIDKTVGSAYTSDAEYYEFFGAQYSQIIYDWTRRVWVRCLMQAPKTPRDKVTVADPEFAIADEEPWEEAQPVVPAKPQSKTIKLLTAIMEQLDERPRSCRDLANLNGVTVVRIKELVRHYRDSFDEVGRGREGSIYGIKGKVYQAVYSKSMPRVVDYLREHGPSTPPVICAALGITYQTLGNAINANPDALVVLEYIKRAGAKKRSPIYGIAGIHDTQKDAA